MFTGELLHEKSGWSKPIASERIACLSTSGKLWWRYPGLVEEREAEYLHVSNALLEYGVTLDHLLTVRIKHTSNPLQERTGEQLYEALNRINPEKHGVVRWHHTTQAYPAKRTDRSGDRFTVATRRKENAPAPAPFMPPNPKHLEYHLTPTELPFYFRMGAQESSEALAAMAPWTFCPDASVKALRQRTRTAAPLIRKKRIWKFKTRFAGAMQAVVMMNNIYCRVQPDGSLYAWRGNRKTSDCVSPLLSSRTQYEIRTGTVYGIEVERPFVRNNGKVCVL